MPAANQEQRAALYAKFGEAWVKRHHFDKLKKKKRKKRRGVHRG